MPAPCGPPAARRSPADHDPWAAGTAHPDVAPGACVRSPAGGDKPCSETASPSSQTLPSAQAATALEPAADIEGGMAVSRQPSRAASIVHGAETRADAPKCAAAVAFIERRSSPGSRLRHANRWSTKHSDVKAALCRRSALKRGLEVGAAARKLQAAWRAARLRAWCKAADRAARILQRWCRRRWLRQALLRRAKKLKELQKRTIVLPVLPVPFMKSRPELFALERKPLAHTAPTYLADVQTRRPTLRGGGQVCPPPGGGRAWGGRQVCRLPPVWVEAMFETRQRPDPHRAQ